MNIWILNHHAREEGRHPSFSKYLSEQGAKVTLFSSSFLHNTFNETKRYHGRQIFISEKKENYERVYIKTLKYHGNGVKRLFNQLSFAYRAYKAGKQKIKSNKSPDVIIGSSVHLFTGLAAYFLSKKSKSKFVFEIRDIWPQTLIDIGALKERSIATKIFERIEKYLYKKADLIISALPNAYEHIMKLDIPREKIIYIPNGIDIDYYNKAINGQCTSGEVIDFFEKNQDKFIVTFAGAHGVANGLNTVVEAARELEKLECNIDYKTQLLLVGDGPEKQKLIRKARHYNLNNISFLNKIEKDQVPYLLKKSDVCLFHLNATPVFNYGISSNKLFDYMISGNPMIFAVETSYNFSKEANNGLSILPEKPIVMANSIIELKRKSIDERNTLGQNGIQFVKENHDLKILASNMLSELTRLTENKIH